MAESNKTQQAQPTVGESPDYMTRMVRVWIPKAPTAEQQSLFVGLNRKNYLIPRGQEVELPLPVWEIIQMSLHAEAQVDAEIRTA